MPQITINDIIDSGMIISTIKGATKATPVESATGQITFLANVEKDSPIMGFTIINLTTNVINATLIDTSIVDSAKPPNFSTT